MKILRNFGIILILIILRNLGIIIIFFFLPRGSQIYYHTKANVALLKSVSHLLYVTVLAICTKKEDSQNQSCLWNNWCCVAYPCPKHDKKAKIFKISITDFLKKIFHINLLKFWTKKLCFKEQKHFIQIITIWGTSTFFPNY